MRRKQRRRRRLQRRQRRPLKRKIPSPLKSLPQRISRPRSSPFLLPQLKNLRRTIGVTMTKMYPQQSVPTAGSTLTNHLLQLPPLTLSRDYRDLLRIAAMILGAPMKLKYTIPWSMIHHFPITPLLDPLGRLPLQTTLAPRIS